VPPSLQKSQSWIIAVFQDWYDHCITLSVAHVKSTDTTQNSELISIDAEDPVVSPLNDNGDIQCFQTKLDCNAFTTITLINKRGLC